MGKKLTSRQKIINKAMRDIAKVRKNIESARQIEQALLKAGKLKSSYVSYNETERMLSELELYLASGKKITGKTRYTMKVISERASKNYFTDLMKMSYNKQMKKGRNIIPVEKSISLSDVMRTLNKFNKNPNLISKEEYRMLMSYHTATHAVSNARAVKQTSKSIADYYRKRNEAVRDIGIGGSSTLINDLAYSLGAEPIGRAFVETLQNIMSDPMAFNLIESKYRGPEGNEARTALDAAVGADWYENFMRAKDAIIIIINSIKKSSGEKLSQDTNEALDEIIELANAEGDDYNE